MRGHLGRLQGQQQRIQVKEEGGIIGGGNKGGGKNYRRRETRHPHFSVLIVFRQGGVQAALKRPLTMTVSHHGVANAAQGYGLPKDLRGFSLFPCSLRAFLVPPRMWDLAITGMHGTIAGLHGTIAGMSLFLFCLSHPEVVVTTQVRQVRVFQSSYLRGRLFLESFCHDLGGMVLAIVSGCPMTAGALQHERVRESLVPIFGGLLCPHTYGGRPS